MSTDRVPRHPDGLHRVGIMVLGMHRSGTSALTWLLGEMGAALPRDAIAASDENSKGYWESSGLVAADERLLRAARSSWFDPRALDLATVAPALLDERIEGIRNAIADAWGAATLLAIKDPRQCRFVPTMVDLLAADAIEARAVLMLRDAGEIADSLGRRDATTRGYGELLWLRHMLDAERDSRSLSRVVTSYDRLLADWRGVAATVAPLLGRDGWEPDDKAAVDAFFDPALRHHAGGGAERAGPLAELLDTAERAFARLIDDDGEAPRAALDEVSRRLAAMQRLEGDIIHDELRHRRVPATALDRVDPTPAAPPVSDPQPAPPPVATADHDGDVRLVRDSGLFDEDWYRRAYPDVAESGADPIVHYLTVGAQEGRDPGPLFNTAYYARQMARRASLGDAR